MSSEVTTLTQQSATFKKTYKCPDRCPTCGRDALVGHGVYYRVDRESGDRYPIPRFSCQSCHATCSVLPEHIAPRRWYGWTIQQQALLLHIAGKSLRAITEVLSPAARTVARWVKRLQAQFLLHGSVLRERRPDLGRACGFGGFWQACIQELSLAQAMRFCHLAHVSVP